MRSRFVAAAVAVVVAASPALAQPSSSAVESQTSAARASKYQMMLNFDAHESLKRGTRVKDASGHRHGGWVFTQKGGKLRSVKGVKKRAAKFPNRCGSCGRAIIEVPDRRGIDPGLRNFSFGAAVKVNRPQVRSGSNVIQKGFYHEQGGQYKLQLNAGGFPTCVLFGSVARVKVTSPVRVPHRKWTKVTCQRSPSAIQLRIDGKVRASEMADVGRIGNSAPIRIGGKKVKAQNKQFHGALDNVFVRFFRTA